MKKSSPHSSQLGLFDADQAHSLAEEAIQRVAENADPDWMDLAYDAVAQQCRERLHFTTDDPQKKLLAQGVPPPHDPRAWGPVMRMAQQLGLCRKAPILPRKSTWTLCHRRPKQVWESLTYGEKTT